METRGYLATLPDTVQLRFMKYYGCLLLLPLRTGPDSDQGPAWVNMIFVFSRLN